MKLLGSHRGAAIVQDEPMGASRTGLLVGAMLVAEPVDPSPPR